MGQVWTRDDWNQLIRKLNQVLQNPPGSTDCGAIASINEVDAGHRWTKSDIREVQDKLKAICKDNTFSAADDTRTFGCKRPLTTSIRRLVTAGAAVRAETKVALLGPTSPISTLVRPM